MLPGPPTSTSLRHPRPGPPPCASSCATPPPAAWVRSNFPWRSTDLRQGYEQVQPCAYFSIDLRRALKRRRAAARNAPAEPTTASTAVGFSGESVQPVCAWAITGTASTAIRSEEHTSELQSLRHLVCRLLL